MAEEQKWREPEGHRLCENNCGFFGNPTTLNLCSKCYRDYCIKDQLEKTLNQTTASSSSSSSSSLDFITSDSVVSPGFIRSETGEVAAEAETPMARARPSRCGACKKRVGLTGFSCRCGTTFCGTHRYPEQHSCQFDFKGLGREAIAKANPVVIAEKLDKI